MQRPHKQIDHQHKLILVGLIFCVHLLGFEALAEPSSTTRLGPLTTSPVKSSEAPTSTTSFTAFRVQNSTYLSAGENYFGSGSSEDLNLRLAFLRNKSFGGLGSVHLALTDQYSGSERWNYLDVHELYWSADLKPVSQATINKISLGRKLDTWAEWESTWQQGVFQSRYLEDRLHVAPAGLIGAFYQVAGQKWNATVGVLPINIPDFGPHFAVRDDHFYSANPWFKPPASQVRYLGQTSDLHYSANRDRLEDIVLKAGAIAKLELQQSGYFTRATFSYKPAPQIALGFPSDGLYQLPDYPKIEIHPRVIYDRVLNWDAGYEQGPLRVSSSITYDNPEDNKGLASWTSQVFAPAWIFALTAQLRLEELGAHATQLEVGVLKIAGGNARDYGSQASDQTKFDKRFQFNEAYLLGLKKQWHLHLPHPLATELRVIYDRMQNGGIFSFNSSYAWSHNWSAQMNLDILGLVSEAPAQVDDGFLASFRANDRIDLGITYVF